MTAKATDDTPCGCGHPHVAHQHYRKGTDCALCDCTRFGVARTPRQHRAIILPFVRRPRSAAA